MGSTGLTWNITFTLPKHNKQQRLSLISYDSIQMHHLSVIRITVIKF